MVRTATHDLQTTGQGDMHDVSGSVTEAVKNCGLLNGIVTVAVTGSTAAVTTIEFEPGAVADFDAIMEVIAPRDGSYRHHEQWGDDNGSSHARAAVVGPSLTLPVIDGELQLGTWQQIVLAEFDTRPRRRRLVIQMIGECPSD